MSDAGQDPTPQDGDIDRIAREIGIPACPAILSRFSEEMHQPEPDTRKLAALISGEIALSAALLKLVNSPFYGLRTKATNAHQALSVIGLRAGANLVTGLILRQTFPAGASRVMQRFWERTEAIAATALTVARRIPGIDPDEAHTYALFRDCGMPVMIGKFPDYEQMLERYDHVRSAGLVAEEGMSYGYSHARVGYALSRGWLLPEPFCKAIFFHHDYEKVAAGRREIEPANRKLVAFGLLVDQIAILRAGGGLCPDWEAGEPFVLTTLGITPEQIVGLMQGGE
ncbi:MAG: HDOD domain-containing protein [Rhodocyclaceae bacterium]|nr:MAG: HDOD domain-containing protein [Rhodocyclaceae bacterium]